MPDDKTDDTSVRRPLALSRAPADEADRVARKIVRLGDPVSGDLAAIAAILRREYGDSEHKSLEQLAEDQGVEPASIAKLDSSRLTKQANRLRRKRMPSKVANTLWAQIKCVLEGRYPEIEPCHVKVIKNLIEISVQDDREALEVKLAKAREWKSETPVQKEEGDV